MGEQNKVVRRKCKIIGSDNIINGSNVTVKIDMIQGDGEKHEIWLKGNLMSLESSTEIPYGYGNTTHCLEIVEREKDKIKKDELDALRTSFDTINARCSTIPNKEQKNMAVKIKKQPVEITLEELKQGEEYERVTIHIDEDKKHEIENKYGIHYGFLPVMNFNDAEFDFKEHYLMVDSNSNKKIPYEIIEKIEVVEK